MAMNRIKEIRERLSLTQEQFGKGIGCTQGNVGHLERGNQVLMPDLAGKVIEFSGTHGLPLTLDQVYGRVPIPAGKRASAKPTTEARA